jgi:glycosyltransferase involved in cell wall biosynthesis
MNILFVTEDHSKNNYGITSVVSQLADELVNFDNTIRVIVVTTAMNPVSQHENVIVEIVPPIKLGRFWGWSPNLVKRLDAIVTKYQIDLIHIHGIWMAVDLAALFIARRRGIPCLITAHAMLEPWLWDNQNLLKKYKKAIYFKLFIQGSITQNTYIHAITPIERDNLQRLFPEQKIFIIPNAISLDKENSYKIDGRTIILENIILFLGRIHPKKGVDLLIDAFYRAELDSKWRLVIVGPESVPQYSEKLKAHILNLNLSDKIKFIGPKYGAEKQELIQKTWVMVTPSYSEGIGMVNLESAVAKVPSITTYETGLWDWEDGGGVLVHPSVDELEDAIVRATKWSIEERLMRGEQTQALVEKKYSWGVNVPKWVNLYSDLVESSKKNG